jgi:Integrase core domain
VAVHGDRRRLGVLLGGAAPEPAQPVGQVDLGARPAGGRRPQSPGLVPPEGDDDNASEFRSAEYEAAVDRWEPATCSSGAGRPQTNGVVERVQETILDECWKPAFARYLIPKYTGLRLDLDRYLDYYNTDRAHTGRWTKGRTPEQVIGKVKMWSRQGRCVARTR